MKEVIDALELPTDNAEDTAKAVSVVWTVLFGPEMQFELAEATAQKVVVKATGCAFPHRQKEMGTNLDCFPVCASFMEAIYKAANPKLEVSRSDKCIQRGDSYCGEWIIDLKE
jgi:hypothetical protein